MTAGTGADAEPQARKQFSARWLLLVVLLLAVTAAIASSQLAVGRVELVMHVTDSAREATIGVRNESNRPVQAIVRLEDWDRSADGANRWYPYGTHTGTGSCSPALEIFPQSLRLEPGAEQSLRVVLDRSRAPTSECWAAAVVETVQPAERDGQQIAYVVRTAVKIYVQPAHVTDEGEIEAMRLVADTSTPSDSSVEVHFANTGTRHVVARGALEVRSPDNAIVNRISLPPVYALPGARHVVRVHLPALKPGNYVILATMDYGGPDIAAALLEHRAR